jgi:hypothetical protein
VNYLINHAGVTFLWRVMQATQKDIGEVMGAYLQADRDAGAHTERTRILAAGLAPADEYAALLKIEEALEESTRAALSGTKAPAPAPASVK